MKKDITDTFNFFALGAICIIAWYFYQDIKKKASINTNVKPNSVFGVRG